LSASTLYSYTVSANDSAGNNSSQSSSASATTQAGAVTPSTGAPTLFFTDIDSGPKTGGENNNGAYVTIYGNNFGSNPTVTVGGGSVTIKSAPSTYQSYQKMSIQ